MLSAAEDAAIVRQALAMLSPAERAALVMWEVEGRSTDEIAAELGIKTAAVRHTVSRARASLRRILTEFVIDEERGLTALDLLSTTYKKSSELAKKSSKVALSFLLVVTAFLGFNSMTGNETRVPVALSGVATGPVAGASTTTPTDNSSAAAITKPKASSEVQTPTAVASTPSKKVNGLVSGFAVKGTPITFAGLDADGIPTGNTITDSNKNIGKLFVGKDAPVLTDSGIVLSNQAMTLSGGPNILLAQSITVDGTGTSYSVAPAAGIDGSWTSLKLSSTTTNIERLANGQYLMTVTMVIDSAIKSDFLLPTTGSGYDLDAAPRAITTRLLLTAGKTQILAQAISVSDTGKGATS